MVVNIPGNIPIPTWIGNICTFERNLEHKMPVNALGHVQRFLIQILGQLFKEVTLPEMIMIFRQ